MSMPLSGAALRAGALEVVVLGGHLLLYPTGVCQEKVVSGAPATRPPVLLLHGFTDNRSVFVLLRRALGAERPPARGGVQLLALHRRPARRGPPSRRRVEELCERTGQERVDLVGHSLGGLVGRYYVQRLGGDTRVRTLVTLGTPHSGTRVAPFMDAHPLVRQIRPDSEVLAELAAPAPGCTTRCVAFWSEFDTLMTPVGTARIEHPDLHAENVQVTGIGHLALAAHPAVIAAVWRTLDGPGLAPSRPRTPPPSPSPRRPPVERISNSRPRLRLSATERRPNARFRRSGNPAKIVVASNRRVQSRHCSPPVNFEFPATQAPLPRRKRSW
ncbi:alpha/beta fold hydrolase [Streptomyces sp. MS1.HAVA.3]|uniref:Alpha/beta fold hydrolase n=1 Tax=Streptomyces caledonius TaxID=3134107 RepID=A0ABU8U4L1_9ACTN